MRQFLFQQFPIRAARAEKIAEILRKKISPSPDVAYVERYPLPVCLQGPLSSLKTCAAGSASGIIAQSPPLEARARRRTDPVLLAPGNFQCGD